ncbi:hypothetical protein [Nitratireductor pacificus]|uniref:hypothetical protein n=1 Tax=Nitratireductor pacificus TaxID=1231180 RepID=UPI0012F67BBA|nr:hypothetical protein [Nitratireductor pacificus]
MLAINKSSGSGTVMAVRRNNWVGKQKPDGRGPVNTLVWHMGGFAGGLPFRGKDTRRSKWQL